MIIYGRNPISEALKARPRQIGKILIADNTSGDFIKDVLEKAKINNIQYQFVDKKKLDELTHGRSHQGIVISILQKEYTPFDKLILDCKDIPSARICLLDEVTDPQNFGAILRNACFFGIMGVVIPKRNSVGLTGSAIRVSTGAHEYVPVSQVSNINYAIEKLKKEGFWIMGADNNEGQVLWQIDIPKPIALVLGSEGTGLSQLVKKNCDLLVKIPHPEDVPEGISSLNVNQASAIIFYEIYKSVYKASGR